MKSNFKLKLLCSILALTLLVTACGNTNSQGTDANNSVENTENVSIQDDEKEVLTNSPEEETEIESEVTEDNTESEVPEENTQELTAEEQEWLNYLMADVELRLRVRKEPNVESDVVGMLEKGARATVIEKGEEWTKIQSGDVEGYVSNEFCLYGLDAMEHAKKVCETVAISNSDLLNIRSKMSTESAVLAKFMKDTKLVVDTSVDTEEGWVAVKYKTITAYVSAEYVTLKLNIGTAITIEEFYARERAEQQAQQQAQQQSKPQGSTSGTGGKTTINSACIVNASEYEILAAMVWCESGNQPYECKLAVASVIMNRVRSSKFPNSVKEVVFAQGQFPPATGGSLEKCLVNGKTTEECYQAALAAMNGEDNTDGCLYFNTYKGDREGLRIGAMVFWKSLK